MNKTKETCLERIEHAMMGLCLNQQKSEIIAGYGLEAVVYEVASFYGFPSELKDRLHASFQQTRANYGRIQALQAKIADAHRPEEFSEQHRILERTLEKRWNEKGFCSPSRLALHESGHVHLALSLHPVWPRPIERVLLDASEEEIDRYGQTFAQYGYTQVGEGENVYLTDCPNNQQVLLHRTIPEAFPGAMIAGWDCQHKKGVRLLTEIRLSLKDLSFLEENA